ncbi:hypothetical protein AwDysgo_21550 [Bacteroidales bacterium]|nr:hypothetical protein AwDysgo_21550 [Bacteroidales bacterium]
MMACNDDFLDRTPETSISDPDFWKSENDIRLYANNFYNKEELLPNYKAYFNMGPFGIDADDGTDTQIALEYNRRMNGELLRPEKSNDTPWEIKSWEVLRNINYFMDNYKKANVSEQNLQQYVGEALFFRSLFYFNKLRQYGDVPFVSKVLSTNSPELMNIRISRAALVDSLMRDLDLANTYLPDKNEGKALGRINKEAGLLLQARIALYEGSWEKYHAGTNFGVDGSDGKTLLQKAAAASKQLIDLNSCDLDNTHDKQWGYWRLFNQEDYASSKEIILFRKYSLSENVTHLRSRYSSFGGARGVTKAMVDSYLCTDGKAIAANTLYMGDDKLSDLIQNRDPRLAQTIYVNDDQHYQFTGAANIKFKYPAFELNNQTRSVTGYDLYKGHNPDYKQYNEAQSTTATIYFRYAEALLIYAEAMGELGEISQNDLDLSINKLRDRVGMPHLKIANIAHDPNWDFPALSPIINEIRRERKVELACEGFRKDDIYRWAAIEILIAGKRPLGAKKQQFLGLADAPEGFEGAVNALQTNANGYIDPYATYNGMGSGYNFKLNRDYLLPIPLLEITLNDKLKQNPNWE